MTFTIKSSKKIEKQLRKLDEKMRQRLSLLFLDLKANPVPVRIHDTVKISGFKNRFRVRMGKIRVIYDIEWNEKTIELFSVERRSDNTYNF
ncbi:MAG: type II toxin-antitoxin system RelE/ParE family toxin [archaeon]